MYTAQNVTRIIMNIQYHFQNNFIFSWSRASDKLTHIGRAICLSFFRKGLLFKRFAIDN